MTNYYQNDIQILLLYNNLNLKVSKDYYRSKNRSFVSTEFNFKSKPLKRVLEGQNCSRKYFS